MVERSYPEIVEAYARLIPVVEDGDILLFDIYVHGKWIGSRRTEQQAIRAAEQALR